MQVQYKLTSSLSSSFHRNTTCSYHGIQYNHSLHCKLMKNMAFKQIFLYKLLHYYIGTYYYTNYYIIIQVLLDHSAPKDWNNGKTYEQTLLGSIFCFSPIPKLDSGPFEFFTEPSSKTQRDIDAIENSIQQVNCRQCPLKDLFIQEGVILCIDLFECVEGAFISNLRNVNNYACSHLIHLFMIYSCQH